jgi:lipopolysaccharide transport system permease protein
MQLVRRDIAGRYRGSALGILWSLLTPLFMLAVFTFVFGTVFKARWQPGGADGAEPSMAEFAIVLFAGLIVFQLFAEVINRAPALICTNVNYVKKVVFPLEILPVVALGSAVFHAAVSLVVLFVFMLVAMGYMPWTALLFPLVLAPFLLLILGLAWFLASLGTYVRDIGQLLGPLVTALMFLSPIFFPRSALPEWIRPWAVLNPVALPVEQAREVLIWGRMPDWTGLALYSIVALVVAGLGYAWFQKTRKGFADVL